MEDDSKKQDNKITQEQPTDDKQQTTDELKTLEAELEKCKKQAEEYLNGWKRAKADYINFKKETEKNQVELIRFVASSLLLKILPAYDGLKRACREMPSTSSGNNGSTKLTTGLFHERSVSEVEGWAEGIINIKKQFEEVFKSFGVEEIKSVGEKFNPEVHEAVARKKQEGVGADMVLEEVSGGYKMNGKTIIPAKVIVSE